MKLNFWQILGGILIIIGIIGIIWFKEHEADPQPTAPTSVPSASTMP